MEKAVTYKANFEEEHGGMCFGWEFVLQGKLSYILEVEHHAENIRRIVFQFIWGICYLNDTKIIYGLWELWDKKMGPNSELRSSSLKIRRKHFLSTIFRHLRINLGKNRIEQSTSIINLFAKVLQAYSYLHDSNEPHQAYHGFARL